MAAPYVSLEQAKKHLMVDASFSEDDGYIIELIEVAESVVAEELCVTLAEIETPEGFMPPGVRQAILLLVGNYYSNREPVAFASSSKVPLSYDYLIGLYRNYKG